MNQAIHFVFVPTLLFSFLVYFAHHPLPGRLPGTYASLVAVCYSAFYVSLDPTGGALYCALMLLPIYHAASTLVARDHAACAKKRGGERPTWKGSGAPLKLAAVLQLLGW